MPRMGFETTIQIFERVKAFHALDKAEPLVYHIFIKNETNETEKVDLSVCLLIDECLVQISAGFVE
jgi:hypothetical protein